MHAARTGFVPRKRDLWSACGPTSRRTTALGLRVTPLFPRHEGDADSDLAGPAIACLAAELVAAVATCS
jgi:hypothetical protein